jgi:hypothetical protein
MSKLINRKDTKKTIKHNNNILIFSLKHKNMQKQECETKKKDFKELTRQLDEEDELNITATKTFAEDGKTLETQRT